MKIARQIFGLTLTAPTHSPHTGIQGSVHSGAHIFIKFGGGVNAIVGPTFRIPIYDIDTIDSQSNFALFAYSNSIDVGTDFSLFIGFSRPTFYTKLYILGVGPPPPPHALMCTLHSLGKGGAGVQGNSFLIIIISIFLI